MGRTLESHALPDKWRRTNVPSAPHSSCDPQINCRLAEVCQGKRGLLRHVCSVSAFTRET